MALLLPVKALKVEQNTYVFFTGYVSSGHLIAGTTLKKRTP
jgi:hypothetical protein